MIFAANAIKDPGPLFTAGPAFFIRQKNPFVSHNYTFVERNAMSVTNAAAFRTNEQRFKPL
ncbi:MAG: hypothetical protein EA408_13775 [Marinilabiliales bacterium]|nr:MAG: hypothetical protein EA408_13775 [Marinilabiliales bacterium]